MESCSVREVFENNQLILERELKFSGLTVFDRVFFSSGNAVITQVKAGQSFPASRFTIQIESPGNGEAYFLRFVYEEDVREMPKDDIFFQLRKQAYEQKDRDLVEMIRRNVSH